MELDDCTDAEEHRRKLSAVDCASGEFHFSWSPCGICGTKLRGNRSAWHWICGCDAHGKRGDIMHEDNACMDCVVWLANGEEPESWQP